MTATATHKCFVCNELFVLRSARDAHEVKMHDYRALRRKIMKADGAGAFVPLRILELFESAKARRSVVPQS